MLDYRYLKVFILTAKHASFSKAAAELCIAQSAISRQIKLLEESLQQELIIRSPKSVILTEKGRELFLAAQDFEARARDIFEDKRTKTIRIGVLQGLLENWSQRILKHYYESYQNNIAIRVGSPLKLKTLLQEGRLDLVLTTENIQSELTTSLKLFDEELLLISKEPVDMAEIHAHRWIIYGGEDNLVCGAKKKSERIVEVNDISTVVQLARSGVGIAVVPGHVVGDLPGLCTQKFESAHRSEIYLATLNFKRMPDHLQELIQFVVDSKHYQHKASFGGRGKQRSEVEFSLQ